MRRSNADPALARLPARGHGLEHLHARGRARVGPRRARRRRLLPGPAARAVRPRRRRGRAAGLDALLPVFVLDRYEGLEPLLLQDMHARERERYVEANAAALREHLPADLVFANHVLMGGPVGAASGARFAVKAHGSELEYSMRGNAELAGVGRAFAAERRRRLRRLRAHPRGARRRRRPRRARPRGAARRGRRRVRRRVAEDALAELLAECRADPPNPGNRKERLPDEGTRSGCGVPRRRRADRPLLREAALQQGRPRAARGAAWPGRPRGDRRLRRLPRASWSGWRRRARCSPARSSTATSSI